MDMCDDSVSCKHWGVVAHTMVGFGLFDKSFVGDDAFWLSTRLGDGDAGNHLLGVAERVSLGLADPDEEWTLSFAIQHGFFLPAEAMG